MEVKVRVMPNKTGKAVSINCALLYVRGRRGATVYQSLSLVRSTTQGGTRERRGRDGGGAHGGNKPRPSSRRQQKTAAPHSNSGGLQVHYIVLPALLLGAVAIVVYLGEAWLLGSGVNQPLPLPRAVSDEWRNDDIYLTRLWGTYR